MLGVLLTLHDLDGSGGLPSKYSLQSIGELAFGWEQAYHPVVCVRLHSIAIAKDSLIPN